MATINVWETLFFPSQGIMDDWARMMHRDADVDVITSAAVDVGVIFEPQNSQDSLQTS